MKKIFVWTFIFCGLGLVLTSCNKVDDNYLNLYSIEYTVDDWVLENNLLISTIDVDELDEQILISGKTRVFLDFTGGSRELPFSYYVTNSNFRTINYAVELNKIHFEISQTEAPTEALSLDFRVMLTHIP